MKISGWAGEDRPMLDHVSLRVADYDRSKRFYAAALAPLGYTLAMETASDAGFRRGSIPDFWIKQGEPMSSEAPAAPLDPAGCGGPAVHVAFDYGAFVLDPDGYNIEAVCHQPE
jgi:catechol 2,3-dioxygenase-like lactoylglutathione lyase family enzyme